MDANTKQIADSLALSSENELFSTQHRRALARAITLVESTNPSKQDQANLLLTSLMKGDQGINSFRVGIAGPPGAGKSSLIETLGIHILDESDKDNETSFHPSSLAVLCVDPSSVVTGGSILGDKSRMTMLSKHPRAYVRPSPTAGVVGGLATYTDDVVAVCRAAGCELILVETVGLGQSELEIAQSVDMVILLVSPGGGDDLQGAKKGIMEIADVVTVNKADGTLLPSARMTAADYKGALKEWNSGKYRNDDFDWKPPVLLASSVTGDGIDTLWKTICQYRQALTDSGLLEVRRQEQAAYWMWKHVRLQVENEIRRDAALADKAKHLQTSLQNQQITPRLAAIELFKSVLLRGADYNSHE